MTEANQIQTVARRYLSPYGRWERFENRVGDGWPDVYYVLRGVTGWVELKLLPVNGRPPDHLTREQIMWGEAEVAAGGRWHMLGRRDAWWVLHDATTARMWFNGEPEAPIFNISGRFPLREVLDRLAPLRNR